MFTDLPIHPMTVHFPIALLMTGFLVDLAARLTRKPWLGHAAVLLLVAGAVGAVGAAQTGEDAEEEILQTPALHEVLEKHEEGGKRTMWVFLVLAAVRIALVWFGRLTPTIGWIFLLLWAGGLILLIDTAHHGGELVYNHGAGVTGISAPGE